jgi:hypothetical protein
VLANCSGVIILTPKNFIQLSACHILLLKRSGKLEQDISGFSGRLVSVVSPED